LKRPLACLLTSTFAAVVAGVLVPSLAARQTRDDSQASSAQAPGRPIYDRVCSRCHGQGGQGNDAPWLVPFGWNYSQALDIVRRGSPCGMPAFTQSELSDEELKQIVEYLKMLN
jgi:mono/diheme cytochrome c family protein